MILKFIIMKKILPVKYAIGMLLLLFLFLLNANLLLGQTVETDKLDYLPGEYVTITGTGWLAGETVELKIDHMIFDDHPDDFLDAIADESGNIFNNEYLILEEELGETFELTATGLTSGWTATAIFTDADGDINKVYQHWADGDAPNPVPEWNNNILSDNKSDYFEGEVIPHVFIYKASNQIPLTNGNSYSFNVTYNYYQQNTNAGGFAFMTTYNISREPGPLNATDPYIPPSMDNTFTNGGGIQGVFYTVDANITQVSNVTYSATGNKDGYVTITFTYTGTTTTSGIAEIYYGLYIAQPEEVPDQGLGPTNGASMWTGGSLQTTVDIGGSGASSIQLSPSAIIHGEISGHKFNDQNNNGVWDAGEPPLSGWTIELYNDNGVVLATEVTDANGYYFFSVTPDADKSDADNDPYYVREVEDQANWTRTKPLTNYYGPLIISADPAIGQTAYTDLDFGNYYCVTPDLNDVTLTVCENIPGGELDGTFDLTTANVGIDGTMTVIYSDADGVIPTPTEYNAVNGTLVTVKAYYTVPGDPTCFDQATITLVVNPRPVLTVADLTECSTAEGGSTAAFDLTGAIVTLTGGTAQYFSGDTEILEPSDYVGTDLEVITVKATSAEDCETTKTFTLNVDPRPVLTVADLTECSTAEGGNTAAFDLTSAIVTLTGGTAQYFSGDTEILEPSDYVGTDAEVITVKATSAEDCETTKTFTLNVDPRPVLTVADLTECSTAEGGNTAAFDLTGAIVTLTGGTAQYFSGDTEILEPSDYVGTDAEVITVKATSAEDCETTKTFTLNVDPRPVLTVADLTECSTTEGGSTAAFDLTGAIVTLTGGTAQYFSGDTEILEPSDYVGTDAEVITVKATSAEDCETTKTFTLNVDPRPVLTVADLTECSTAEGGNTAAFDLTGAIVTLTGGTAQYFSGDTEILEPSDYVGTDAEVITVKATSAEDCETTKTFTLNVDPRPVLTVADLTECSTTEGGSTAAFDLTGAIVTLTGGTAQYFSGDTEILEPSDYVGTDAEVITVKATSAEDCETTKTFTLNVDPRPVLTVADLTECSTAEGGSTAAFDLTGAIVTLTGGTAQYFSGDTEILEPSDYVGTDAEVITVKATSAEDCETTKTFTLNVDPRPVLTVADLTECSTAEGGNTAAFDLTGAIVTLTGGTAQYFSGDTEILEPSDYVGTDAEVITVKATSAEDCETTKTFTLNVDPRPVLTVADLTECSTTEGGSTAAFDLTGAIVTLTGGTAQYFSGDTEILEPSDYVGTDAEVITVKATSAEDCETTKTFTLNVDPRPVLTVADLTECSTAEGGNTAAFDLTGAIVTLTGGTAQYFSGDTEILEPSDYVGTDAEVITVKATSAEDCETTKTFTLNVDPRPVLTVADLTECSTTEGGSTAAFDLTGAIVTLTGGTAQYFSGDTEILEPSDYVGTDAEVITVKATSAEDCETTKTFTLNVDPRPVLTVADLTECSTAEGGNTAAFDLTGAIVTLTGGTAQYFIGDTEILEPSDYVGTDAEVITVKATSAEDCETTKTFTLNVDPRPVVLDASAIYCEGEDAVVNFDLSNYNDDVLGVGQDITFFTFDWSNGSLNLPGSRSLPATTTFNVVVTDIRSGCSNEADLEITINPCSWLELLKTTNGVVDPLQTWTFNLYEGAFPALIQIATASTSGDLDGILFGDTGPLSRNNTYTVCEQEVPAGFGNTWMIDSDGDGIFEIIPYTTYPGTGGVYNPNSVDNPPQDLGNRCYEFPGTLFPLNQYGDMTPLALHFQIENTYPGGEARTPGYWKNWNTCSGGGQQYTATENSTDLNGDGSITAYDRVNSGWALLDDIIELFGITWGDFELTTCNDARLILDNRNLDGINKASDPAYNLAKHLLAYQLNQGAGAYVCPEMAPIETEAIDLLVGIGFDGISNFLQKPKSPADKALANRALELGKILDAYNNNAGCDVLAEMIGEEEAPPAPPATSLSCSAAVTKEISSFKGSDGEITVTASNGTTPYLYQIGSSGFVTTNVFTGLSAGTYTFTVKDADLNTCTCSATLVQPRKKSAEIDPAITKLKVYPNPFNEVVNFEFTSASDVNAVLEIHNMLGQKIAVLFDSHVYEGVLNTVKYKPVDVSTGVLIYRLILGEEVRTGRIIFKE
jgi:hypothetical protein